ncbi:hypothetical protein BKA62DRAFT_700242 [Auriculariales sp. MPI-PUGE-AT-0066]|nr:hypothetical protein BKA62DRAFT_700242 [Auriculariales sp. MPI-PUGE-AT-0066]
MALVGYVPAEPLSKSHMMALPMELIERVLEDAAVELLDQDHVYSAARLQLVSRSARTWLIRTIYRVLVVHLPGPTQPLGCDSRSWALFAHLLTNPIAMPRENVRHLFFIGDPRNQENAVLPLMALGIWRVQSVTFEHPFTNLLTRLCIRGTLQFDSLRFPTYFHDEILSVLRLPLNHPRVISWTSNAAGFGEIVLGPLRLPKDASPLLSRLDRDFFGWPHIVDPIRLTLRAWVEWSPETSTPLNHLSDSDSIARQGANVVALIVRNNSMKLVLELPSNTTKEDHGTSQRFVELLRKDCSRDGVLTPDERERLMICWDSTARPTNIGEMARVLRISANADVTP